MDVFVGMNDRTSPYLRNVSQNSKFDLTIVGRRAIPGDGMKALRFTTAPVRTGMFCNLIGARKPPGRCHRLVKGSMDPACFRITQRGQRFDISALKFCNLPVLQNQCWDSCIGANSARPASVENPGSSCLWSEARGPQKGVLRFVWAN